MNHSEKYNYWKKPWHKWAVLGGAILQMIGLNLRIQEYRDISRPEIRTRLFSESGWERYVTDQYFQFSISIIMIFLFLGCFVIGIFARSKRTSDISMGILLIIFTLFWCIIGFVIPVFSKCSMMITWSLLLIVLLAGSVYTIWTSRKL